MASRRSWLAWLALCAWATSAAALSIGQSKFRVAKSPSARYIVAPELLRHESFAFARIEAAGERPGELGVEVSIVNRTSARRCSVRLTPAARAASAGVTAIRRLAWGRVLIVAHDELPGGEREVVPLLLNFEECLFVLPYSRVLPKRHAIFTTNSVRDDRNRFVIVAADRTFCSPHNSCAVVVAINLPFSELEGFDVAEPLSPETARIEPLSVSYDRHLFAVQGLDAAGAYSCALYDTRGGSGRRTQLLSLPDAGAAQIVSSKLAVCWIERPATDAVVHCSKFSGNGSLAFRRSVRYEQPVTISFVESTFLGLLLFASKWHCEGLDCWTVFVSSMSEDDRPEPQGYHAARLACTGDRERLLVFKARKDVGSIQAEYVCDNGHEFTFNVVGVADQQ